jgi:hypothetical protein
MNIQLTEEVIRQRASAQSYQKGYDCYDSGSIYNWWLNARVSQAIPAVFLCELTGVPNVILPYLRKGTVFTKSINCAPIVMATSQQNSYNQAIIHDSVKLGETVGADGIRHAKRFIPKKKNAVSLPHSDPSRRAHRPAWDRHLL